MATRGYPPQQRHYQPPPPQRQYGYDQRPDPRWQEPPPQRMPPPRQQPQPPPPPPPQQQYSEYDNQYGYQQDYGGYDQGYEQQGYYQDQQYQNSQQYNDPYYDEHRGHPPPQREYHYDERYHQQSQGRQQPATQQPSSMRDQQRPPPLQEQKKPKARERILAEPESPKTLAWDNPFGAFPPKKKEEDKKDKKDDKSAKADKHKRHGSLDSKQPHPAGWDAPDRRGDLQDPRPHTSHGHRKNNEPYRPGTSQGQQPPEPPVPGFEDDDMRWKRHQQDPAGPSAVVAPLRPAPPPAAQQLPSRPGPPQRSVTQPSVSNTGPVGVNGYDYNRPANDKHAMVGLRQPVRQASDHQYDRDPNYGASISKSHTWDQPQDTPEMPNFDAMAPNVAETLTGPKTVATPAYAKKSYQALAIETKPPRPVPPQTTASPLADFSFDLPQSHSAPPAMDDGVMSPNNRGQLPPAMGQYDNANRNRGLGRPPAPAAQETPFDYNNPPLSPPIAAKNQRNYDARVAPPGPARAQNQTPASNYPPRGASRPDLDASRHPSDQFSQQDSGHWTTSPEQKPVRPGTATGSRGGPGYGRSGSNEQDQGYGYSQGYGDQYPQDGYGQQEGYGRGQPGQGYDRMSPPRQGYPPNVQGGPPRPATSNSAHPTPVRNYADRGSSDAFRPDMPPSSAGGMDRPPPVRPGLLNSQPPQQRGPPGPPMQQQPPMRQQQQQQSQAQPQSAPPSQRTSGAAEEKKPPVTVAELNQMREQFKERPNDFALGLRFAKRLVEAAKVLSHEDGRADPKQVARNRERYINDAHKVVKKMVNAGSTEAMFYMADCYGQGSLGLPMDPKEAFHLYQSAAKMNHPQSAYRVAVCCELGTEEGGGTRRDPMKAIQWYKRAATLGDTPAMYKMGMILLKGLLGQQRDPRQAVSWLKRAAERADKDNPHALHELGLLYESAKPEDHILRDERYAFELFQQAAELGYKYSQFRLGSVFEYGALGCPMDQRMSIQWYSKAAQAGEHQSELALSGWYLTGATGPNGEVLVQQNDQEAFLWARKAASSGLAKAEFAMGYYCEMGIGTHADTEEGKRWYYRAAAQGFPKARERLEELKMGAKGRKRDIRRSNAKEGDCIVM